MTPEQREFILALDQDGTLTPDAVLEAARPKGSPIHDLFTWDDKVAGARYRIEEARTVIRRVRVEIITESREIRTVGYIRDPERAHRDQGYVKTKLLRTRAEVAMEALDAEIMQVAARIERVRKVAIGLGLEAECELRLAGLLAPPVEAVEAAS
jgi:hypothetical protein